MLSQWRSPIVVVIASYDGIVSNAPWLVNSTLITYVIYQRTKPWKPNYVPNIGYEAGVYLRFVLDHYDDLPSQVAFVQEHPEMHNRAWLEWVQCVLPSQAYAPLVYVRILTRDFREIKDGLHAVTEQCWRNFLRAFGLPNKSGLQSKGALSLIGSEPGARPTHAFYGGALMIVSGEQLRKQSREAYRRADALTAGGDGRCHAGPLNWTELYAKPDHHPKTVMADAPSLTKHTQAAAMERLQHVLFGGMGLRPPFQFKWCSHFQPSHQCFGSPCQKRGGNGTGTGTGEVMTPLPTSSSRRSNRIMMRQQHHHANAKAAAAAADVDLTSIPTASLISSSTTELQALVHNAQHGSPSPPPPPPPPPSHGHARWYVLPYRGAHKRFARRHEVILEGHWRLRTTSEFSLNVTFRSWASKQMSTTTTAESDKVHNVSLPQMMIYNAEKGRGTEQMIRRVAHPVNQAWWAHGRVACGFSTDRMCDKYNKLNAGKLPGLHGTPWNRTVRQQAARSGTVTRSHSMDFFRDIL